MSREGWFSANFEFDFLLPQSINLGNLVHTGEKFQPLILLGRIPTVGSK